MSRKTWTNLTQDEQADITSKLDGGGNPYKIAEEYNLYPPSLARTWRRIKQRRSNSGKKAQRITAVYQNTVKPTTVHQTRTMAYDGMVITVINANELLPNERFMFVETTKPINILFYSDSHFAQQNDAACDAFIRAAAIIPHDLIVHGGDAIECYGLSSYGKDERKVFINSLHSERKAWYDFATKLNNVSDAPKLMILGNHTDRYYQWLKNNPTFMQLEEFEMDNILKLEELGYAPMVNSIFFDGVINIDYPNPKLVLHHGTVARKGAGNSGRSESELRGLVSSVSGHTHRLSVSYRRTLRGQTLQAESGCLRTLSPDWCEFPDWTTGFLEISYSGQDDYITANPINIVDGYAIYNGSRI